MNDDDDYTPFDEVNDLLNIPETVVQAKKRLIKKVDHTRRRMLGKSAVLYKFYNNRKELLYVGVTSDILTVLAQFPSTKEWFYEVDTVTEEAMERSEAFALKKKIINTENPKYNKTNTKMWAPGPGRYDVT